MRRTVDIVLAMDTATVQGYGSLVQFDFQIQNS